MDNVLFNYVVNGVVVEGPMPYREVLARTGLKDTVGLFELGYMEYFEPQPEVVVTQEQIQEGIRGLRNSLLQQSDWTQLSDVQLTTEKKAEWATYRQALRNMPETFASVTSINEVIRPTTPT